MSARLRRWGLLLLVWAIGAQAIPLGLVATWGLIAERSPDAISHRDALPYLLLSLLGGGGLAVIGVLCARARRGGSTAWRYRSAVWLGVKGYALFMAVVVAALYLLDGAKEGVSGFVAAWGLVVLVGAAVNVFNLFTVVPLVIHGWYRVLNGPALVTPRASR